MALQAENISLPFQTTRSCAATSNLSSLKPPLKPSPLLLLLRLALTRPILLPLPTFLLLPLLQIRLPLLLFHLPSPHHRSPSLLPLALTLILLFIFPFQRLLQQSSIVSNALTMGLLARVEPRIFLRDITALFGVVAGRTRILGLCCLQSSLGVLWTFLPRRVFQAGKGRIRGSAIIEGQLREGVAVLRWLWRARAADIHAKVRSEDLPSLDCKARHPTILPKGGPRRDYPRSKEALLRSCFCHVRLLAGAAGSLSEDGASDMDALVSSLSCGVDLLNCY